MTVPGTAGPSFQYRPPSRGSGSELEPPRTSRPSRNMTGGSIAHQDRELRELLRRRLLISAAVIVGFFGLLPLSSLRFMGSPDVPMTAQLILASQWVVALLSAAIAVLVSHRPTRTLHTLRWLEMLMFGFVVIQLIVGNGYVIQRFGLMTPPIETIAHPVITQNR